MQLCADFGDEKSGQKHANAYLRDCLCVFRREEVEFGSEASVDHHQEDRKTGLQCCEQRLSHATCTLRHLHVHRQLLCAGPALSSEGWCRRDCRSVLPGAISDYVVKSYCVRLWRLMMKKHDGFCHLSMLPRRCRHSFLPCSLPPPVTQCSSGKSGIASDVDLQGS